MLVHTALNCVLGTNPGLQLKVMVAPSAALWKLAMNPRIGEVGSLQPAVHNVEMNVNVCINAGIHTCIKFLGEYNSVNMLNFGRCFIG